MLLKNSFSEGEVVFLHLRSQEEGFNCRCSSPAKSYIGIREPKFGLHIELHVGSWTIINWIEPFQQRLNNMFKSISISVLTIAWDSASVKDTWVVYDLKSVGALEIDLVAPIPEQIATTAMHFLKVPGELC